MEAFPPRFFSTDWRRTSIIYLLLSYFENSLITIRESDTAVNIGPFIVRGSFTTCLVFLDVLLFFFLSGRRPAGINRVGGFELKIEIGI